MNNEITSSASSIQKRWLNEIAPKFFNINDINLLNAGLFGYVNEAMSNMLEDTLNSANVYYNEVIPATAILPQSIYSYASMTDDEDYNAVPATVPITFAIRTEEIINKAVHRNGILSYRTFLIDRHTSIIIDGDKHFMFDYDIEIIVKEVNQNGKYVLTPVYNLDGRNERSNIKNKYIKSVTINVGAEEYLFMSLKVRQMERQRTTISVSARDILDTLSFEVPYIGKLSHFNVYYQEKITDEPRLISKFFMDNLKPEVKEFCFYEYLNEQKLRIFFSPYSSYFKPENGTKLIVDVYTTDGADGNFSYTGTNFLVKFNTDNANIGHDYKGLVVDMRVSGDSEGGTNGKTLMEIKQSVLDSFSTRKGLINENDLAIFFKKNKKNSDLTFLKKRDDILSRLYSAFILLKDDYGNVIPSNTINLLINENECLKNGNNNSYIIKAGKTFESNETNDMYEYINLDEGMSVELKESIGKFVNTNPYLIQVSDKPLLTKYYLNTMNDSFNISHKYMNYNIQHEFMVNKIRITRDAIFKKENAYNVDFAVNTTLDLLELEKYLFPTDGDNKKRPLIVKGILKNNGNDIACFDCIPTEVIPGEQKIKYSATLRTSDYVDESSALEMLNLISIYESGGTPSFFIPNTDVTLEILIYYNGYEDKTKEKLNHLSYLKDYCLVTIYETEDTIQFIKDLSGITNSYVSIQPTSIVDVNKLYIKSVPTLRTLYIDSSETVFKLYKDIYYHAKLLLENVERIENNFDLDYKFFNTYGKSKYYLIGNNGDLLNRTNIKLSFRIKLLLSPTNEISEEIKTFIKSYIESKNSDSSAIYISNLIKELEQNFKYIHYTEFISINDYPSNNQIIEARNVEYNSLSKKEISNYVPEYININKVYDPIVETLVPEINLEFV